MRPSPDSARSILSSTALNFLGQFIPLLFSIVMIPLVVKGLGVQALGLLSFCWVLLGYFSLFDFGLGRATTRFVAEAAGSADAAKLRNVFWASLSLQGLLGVIAGVALVLATPVFVRNVPGMSADGLGEATISLYLVSAAIPLLLVSSAMRGAIEGVMRFDLANLGRGLSGIFNAGLPLVGIMLGLRLTGIVALQVLSTLAAAAIYGFLLSRALPSLWGWRGGVDLPGLRQLLSYGGWIAVINVVSPILTYIDRILLGTIVSVSALAYYHAPYSVVSRLWIIPGSFFVTLFPLFSGLHSEQKRHVESSRLLMLSSKYLVLITGPVVLVFVMFAQEMMTLWLGWEFAAQSTRAFQLLSVGFLLSSVSWAPSTMLQGVGRPDLVAKVFLLEAPFYVVAAWWLIGRFGLNGAALAWTARSVADLILLFGAAARGGWIVQRGSLMRSGVSGTLLLLAVIVAIAVKSLLVQSAFYVRLAEMGAVLVIFSFFAWVFVLDDRERGSLRALWLRVKPGEGMSM